MPRSLSLRPLVAAAAVTIAACTSSGDGATTTTTVAPTTAPPQTTTTEPAPQPGDELNLVLMWHQHQPLYPKDADGIVSRPWVRVHATKDYYDMAALVADYPDVHVTFNLTPVLLRQIEELTQGTKDLYWSLTEIPAEELSDDQRSFIIDRFFDTNAKVVARFPRYQELIDKRDRPGSFTTADVRDLQVLFNLAWTDPSFLSKDPLGSLVAKGRAFTEEDKAIVLGEHRRIIAEVLPLHRRLWESGQIEVTTTPLAHPILPLVADSELATFGDPTGVKPINRFRMPGDAVEHIVRGLDEAERLLGRRPTGMWPGEGSVAQPVMGMFANNGVRWVATGEDVLAKTLDIGSFNRDGTDLVERSDLLYRMYRAAGDNGAAMFFRDVVLSDRIGFEYSGTAADAAADDFMNRLRAIDEALEATGEEGPKVVSVILDGENAWEHYDNDGIDFLNALYSRLAEADFVRTVTPNELLDMYPGAPEPLPDVFPGAWFEPGFTTWIGEDEEARAWDYLFRTRSDLGRAQRSGQLDETALNTAYETMLFAEGSDWFWWYGSDKDSGDDGYFDAAFRELLGQVYDALGSERPTYVRVPITEQASVDPAAGLSELVTVEIDNDVATEEWRRGGRYDFSAGDLVASLHYAFDKQNLYLRADFGREVLGEDNVSFDIYLTVPGAGRGFGLSAGGSVLGSNGTHRLSWTGRDPVQVTGPAEHRERAGDDDPPTTAAGFDGQSIEFAVPIETLGALEAGDRIKFRIVETSGGPDGNSLPGVGPGYIQVPDISDVDPLFDVADPSGDDHGPGSYTYPEDGVFGAGSYDLTNFNVGLSGADTVVFSFEVGAQIGNPWGSPAGYSVQTFDIYLDVDPGEGSGARMLLPGRNAALPAGNGWEYGLTLEGWDPALYIAEPDGSVEETKPTLKVITDPDGRVTARIPLELLGGGDPASWAYSVVVMSQEGFPSPGVRRIRDVNPVAEQWKGGGAPEDVNHTRIYDLLYPEPGVQERLLSDYVPSAALDGLGPDDFPQVPMVAAG